MSTINKTGHDDHKETEQWMMNNSFDREFKVLANENLVYNEKTGALDRMVQPGQALPTSGLNASLTISNSDMVEASTKTITKTIGTTSYTKTLSINAGGDVVGVSAWTEV